MDRSGGTERLAAEAPLAEEREKLLRHLFRGTPEDILARLSQGDALELTATAAKRVRERGLLLDPDLLYLRANARLAYYGAEAPVGPAFDAWLLARVDEAIDDLLEADRRDVEAGNLSLEPEADPRAHFVAGVAGMEPGLALQAGVAFNALPEPARRVFFELIIEARSVEECLEAGLAGSPDELRRLAWQALDVFDPDGTAQAEYREERGIAVDPLELPE